MPSESAASSSASRTGVRDSATCTSSDYGPAFEPDPGAHRRARRERWGVLLMTRSGWLRTVVVTSRNGGQAMPKISKERADTIKDYGPVVDRSSEVDGYTINIVTFN